MNEVQRHDLRVAALGGGHGLAASLAALRRVTTDLTAIVTVADDGGSSGRLRREFGCLPPGDLRQALAALCSEEEWGATWARVLQHRFDSDGEMDQHALGNLLIVSLWQLLGDHVRGLDWVARLLGAEGRVLPMALTSLDITATVEGADPAAPTEISTIRGQYDVATTPGRVLGIALDPPDPPGCPEAVAAIERAEWTVLGPGSWFTSVITHLLVPDLRTALETSPGRKLVVLNLAEQHGETAGFAPETHLEVLADQAPGLHVDVVLADRSIGDHEKAVRSAAEDLGAELVVEDVGDEEGLPRHDPVKLARAYAEVLTRT